MAMGWQGDLYLTPFKDDQGQELWELLVCTDDGILLCNEYCPAAHVNQDWLIEQLRPLMEPGNEFNELRCEVFRPQSLALFKAAGEVLNFNVIPTRRTLALKALLKDKAASYFHDGARYNPTIVEELPPTPLPENLWGDEWRFATLPGGDLIEAFRDRPIPYLHLPETLWPINLGLSSAVPVPGIIVYGGKKSQAIAQWVQTAQPHYIKYMITEIGVSGGLVCGHGLNQRSILATFTDSDIAQAGKNFEQKKEASQGLHFLLLQPDDSGVTYTGMWLLAPDH